MCPATAKRDLLSIADLASDLTSVLARAHEMKSDRRRGNLSSTLAGTNLGMIFEKPSTRTRTSFEVAMNDLGGHAIYLSPKDMQLGRGETIADTARVLSRYVDAIVYRAFRHADEVELARHATVPVINALDDREHPCQIVADLLTLYERWDRRLGGRTLAYVGDGNNVLNSLLLGSALVGLNLTAAIPRDFRPPADLVDQAKGFAARSGATLRFVEKPAEAARDADALYTDVWVSMGDEADKDRREAAFRDFQINSDLLRLARPDVWVLHDLPAHRGQEITDEVLDGPRSAAWDQAENRLHAQKAILERLLGRPPISA
ncbi:MAG TPA: ornithine carbamoyltransferase [Thermoplasmata archaeon]|nr:ornithine carbamoyltransferase [Thermoplasmata archaeon]